MVEAHAFFIVSLMRVLPRNSALKIQEQLDGYEVSITGDISSEVENEGIANIDNPITDYAHVLYTNRNEGPTVDNVETSDLVDRVQTAKFTKVIQILSLNN